MTEVAQLMADFNKMSRWEQISALVDAFDDLPVDQQDDLVNYMQASEGSNLLKTNATIIRRMVVADASF